MNPDRLAPWTAGRPWALLLALVPAALVLAPRVLAGQEDAAGWAWEVEAEARVHGTRQAGERGAEGVYLPNHLEAAAWRALGDGVLALRAELSLEPWTVGPRGAPQLLQTEGLYRGRPLRDRQHPHDLFSELSASLDVPLGRGVWLSLLGAAAGTPAYGAAASGAGHEGWPGPSAPIGRHGAELAFGAFTASASAWDGRLRVEASLFNGREPDGDRTDLDLRRLDSYAGRLVLAPGGGWTLSGSWAHLDDPEPVLIAAPVDSAAGGAASLATRLPPGGGPRRHIVVPAESGPPPPTTLRVGTVSLSRALRGEGAVVAAYSVSQHAYEAHRRQSALLGVSLPIGPGTVFGRAEFVETTDFSLEVDSLRPPDERRYPPGVFPPLPVPLVLGVGVLSGGYERRIAGRSASDVSVGVEGTLNLLPGRLERAYGLRTSVGLGVFVRIRFRGARAPDRGAPGAG